MVLGVVIALFVVAVAVGVYFMVLSPHAGNASNLISGSYEALRSSDLSLSKDFDVQMHDTQIGDLFSDFPEDDSGVLTAQTIVEEVDKVRKDMPRFHYKRRSAR